jgi:hypothetical protein
MQALLVLGSALPLSACGIADSRAPVPEFMRAKTSEISEPESPPDLARILHDNLGAVFSAESHPDHVRVSAPNRDPHGLGWTACVRAEFVSVTGTPLGTQTYRIFVKQGEIFDRRRVDENDNCNSEKYMPV